MKPLRFKHRANRRARKISHRLGRRPTARRGTLKQEVTWAIGPMIRRRRDYVSIARMVFNVTEIPLAERTA